MLKQELAPRGVGIPVLQGEEEVNCVSWIAGEFIRIVFWQPPRRTKEQINADVEAMLKAASNEVHDRPRIKAITEPINRRH